MAMRLCAVGQAGETFAALNEKTYDLGSDMLVIGDADGLMILPGSWRCAHWRELKPQECFLKLPFLTRFQSPTIGVNSTFIQMRAIVLTRLMRQRRKPWPGYCTLGHPFVAASQPCGRSR